MGDDGGEFLCLDVLHEAAHEVPIRRACIVNGKLYHFVLEACITPLIVEAVFTSYFVGDSSNEHASVFVEEWCVS